jgi:hypothetical protein
VDATQIIAGKYIKSEQFGGKEPLLTIADVKLENVEPDEKKAPEFKGVVTFAEKSKRPPHAQLRWLLNVTNCKALIAMFGKETEAWKGKRVVLYSQPMTDPFTKLPITAIRVRGSPDLEKDVQFSMRKRGQKQPEIHKVIKTGGAPVPMPEEASSNG